MTHSDKLRLREAIQSWRKGDPLPDALMNFPPHRPDPHHRCGMMMWGEFVDHYIYDIHDADLLEALILQPRTSDDCLRAALKQSLRSHGFARTAALLPAAERKRPDLLRRPAFADMRTSLGSPCVRLKIARFEKDRPVPLDRAWEVLRVMQDDLRSGKDWRAAYGRASEAMRDEAHHKPGEAFNGPTHLSYALDGSATPGYVDLIGGWDLRTYQYASIPDGHLEVVFEAKGGTHLIDMEEAIWLYHAEEYFCGLACKS